MEPLIVLRRGIRLARRVESLAPDAEVRKPIGMVAFGFTVRNRRLATAIERLGLNCAYEGRMLLRSMIEILINYAWIRLRKPHSRALRYIAYHPLERLNVHRLMRETLEPEMLKESQRYLEEQRRRVRHLFRFRDKNGKMQWARSWASVSSLEARLQEVKADGNPSQSDPFLYGLYAWISSAVHGGPHSLDEVLTSRDQRIVAKEQPEQDPTAQIKAAATTLAFTLRAAVDDLKLKKVMKAELDTFMADMEGLRKSHSSEELPKSSLR